jgi:hypothetical protein
MDRVRHNKPFQGTAPPRSAAQTRALGLEIRAAMLGLALLVGSTASAGPPGLNCALGPAAKTFGGSQWLVYACDDNHSVVVVSAPGSPAMPFFFMFSFGNGRYRLQGEGTGEKVATDAAYKQLSVLTESDIRNLFEEAVRARR